MKNKKISLGSIIWYGILAFFVLGYILLPFGHTLLQSLKLEKGYGLDVFAEFFANPNHVETVKNTFLMGGLSTLTCGVIGISLAMYMTFLAGKWKKVVHILLLSPMMIPGVIIVISFIQLYGESGIITKAIQYLLGLKEAPFYFWGLPAVIFVIMIASAVTYGIQYAILVPLKMEYMQTIVFILVIAALVQMIEMLLKKISPAIYQALGVYLPLITTNCAVLGVAINNISLKYSFAESMINSLGTSGGFLIAIVIMAGIRERLEGNDIPKAFRGMPIVLITAGLMAIAFCGFAGVV